MRDFTSKIKTEKNKLALRMSEKSIDQDFSRTARTISQSSGQGITDPYKQDTWIYTSVHTIASNIQRVPTIIKKGENIVESGPIFDLWTHPNPFLTQRQVIEATYSYLGIRGRAVWVMPRNNITQIPEEIWPIDPNMMELKRDEKSGLPVKWIFRGKESVSFALDEVLLFAYFNPGDPFAGFAPWKAASSAVEQNFFAGQYNTNFFKEGAVMSGFIEVEQRLQDPQWNKLKNQMEDRHKGYNKSHRMMLLEGGAKFKETKLTQRDMEFIETKKLTRKEIFAVYGVPEVIAGFFDDVKSEAGTETIMAGFWEQTLLPQMEFLQDIWNTHFFSKLSGGPYVVEFDISEIKALQIARKDSISNAKELWAMGVPFNTIDKVESLGVGEIPGGDVGYLPMNLMPTDGEVEEPEDTTDENKSIELKDVKLIDSKNDRIWKTFIVKQTSIEKLLKKEIKNYFHKQRKKALANLAKMFKNRKVKSIDDDLIDTNAEISLLKSILFPIYIIAEEEGATMIAEEIGLEGFIFDPLDSSFLSPMEVRLRNVAPALVETVKDGIRISLTEGIAAGEGVGELSDRVRKVYNEAGNRATTIARTESATAINRGRQEMMNKQGIKKSEWLTAKDSEVRDSHRALDGAVADLGAAFRYVRSFPDSGIISGGYSQLRFPNDPQAPAAEVINCFIDGQIPILTSQGWKGIKYIKVGDLVLTHTGKFRKVTRLSPNKETYKGETVKIWIKTGRASSNRPSGYEFITVTPNHRILTDEGWKEAKDITEADKVHIAMQECKECNDDYPILVGGPNRCSKSCHSKAQAREQYKDPNQKKIRSEYGKAQMKREYANGTRDKKAITEKANEKCRELVRKGEWVLQSANRTFPHWLTKLSRSEYLKDMERRRKVSIAYLSSGIARVTSIEKKMKESLKINNIKAKFQYPLLDYVADFAIPEKKIVIECDGDYWHNREDTKKKDKIRDARMKGLGWTVMRFSETRINANIMGCIDELQMVLRNHNGEFSTEGFKVDKVEIKQLKRGRKLYNFAVDKDESYVARGIISHNCRCITLPIIER